jgi:hypothetical protein
MFLESRRRIYDEVPQSHSPDFDELGFDYFHEDHKQVEHGFDWLDDLLSRGCCQYSGIVGHARQVREQDSDSVGVFSI